MKNATAKKKLSIIESHEYMSLVTPNGRFTMGYRGEKASGNLVNSKTTFDNLINFVNGKVKSDKLKFGEAFRMLADEKVIAALWPEWDVVEVNPYKGDGTERVEMAIAKYTAKYGPGTIVEVRKLNVFVKFDNQPNTRTQMDFKMVKPISK